MACSKRSFWMILVVFRDFVVFPLHEEEEATGAG